MDIVVWLQRCRDECEEMLRFREAKQATEMVFDVADRMRLFPLRKEELFNTSVQDREGFGVLVTGTMVWIGAF